MNFLQQRPGLERRLVEVSSLGVRATSSGLKVEKVMAKINWNDDEAHVGSLLVIFPFLLFC